MKKRPVLRSADWPEQDRVAFAAAFRATANPFIDEGGPGGRLRERTVNLLRQLYGYWLGFLLEREPEALAVAPGDRITIDRIRAYAESLDGLQPVSRAAYVKAVYDAARYIEPERDWRWLRTIVTRLERVIEPAHRPLQIDALGLRDVGLKLISTAKADIGNAPRTRRTLRDACERWRDGLFIVLATTIPLRRSNLAGLQLAETIQKIGSTWWIAFAARETKSGRPFETRLPQWLGDHIDAYLAGCRHLFPAANQHPSLWPSWRGDAMTPGSLYSAFVRRVRRNTGIALRLHDVRAIAATSLTIADPMSAAAATPLLGHVNARVTHRHYVRAGTLEAARMLDAEIDKLGTGHIMKVAHVSIVEGFTGKDREEDRPPPPS